jgi:UDP-N-acetylglucosamine acyltransferase
MPPEVEIHPSASVSPGAELAPGVRIGPYTVVGDQVRLGAGTQVGSHVVLEGPTEIGRDCRIAPHAVLGTAPQDLKYRGEATRLRVGDGVVVREFATLNRGTVGGGGLTSVGDRSVLMAYCHVAHDCHLGREVIMANCATLAGHVAIEDFAIIGGLAGVHQFVKIGCYALVGACSGVLKDIPPYVKAQGIRARLYGLNTVGLRRHQFPPETIRRLKAAYRLLFHGGLNTSQALERIASELDPCPEVEHLVAFIKSSSRGVAKARQVGE